MHRLEPEMSARFVEREERHSRQQRIRAAASLHMRRAGARRTDKVDALDEHARRMFFTKQDHTRDDEIHEARTKRAGPAHLALRIIAAADEIDVALSVDLAAAEKERIDAALRRAIEKLDPAI